MPNEILRINWLMNAESDLDGYKVYAGTATGQYTIVQDVGLTDTTGSPSALVAGFEDLKTWHIAVTAYDVTGNESTFSAEVSRAVAMPHLRIQRSFVQ